MKARTCILLGLAVSLALALTAAVAAQGPDDGALEHQFQWGGGGKLNPHSLISLFPRGLPSRRRV